MTAMIFTPSGSQVTIDTRRATGAGQRGERKFLIETLMQLGAVWPGKTAAQAGRLCRRLAERQVRPPGRRGVPGLRPSSEQEGCLR